MRRRFEEIRDAGCWILDVGYGIWEIEYKMREIR